MPDLDDMMDRYRNFRPTGVDASGLGCHDQQGWFVLPVGRNRDNKDEPATASNWDAAIAALDEVDTDDEIDAYETHSFGHWANGWFEIVLINPNHPAACRVAAEIAAALDAHPLLDEDRYYELRYEQACETWETMGMSDRIALLDEERLSIFAARRDHPMTADPSGRLLDSLQGL